LAPCPEQSCTKMVISSARSFEGCRLRVSTDARTVRPRDRTYTVQSELPVSASMTRMLVALSNFVDTARAIETCSRCLETRFTTGPRCCFIYVSLPLEMTSIENSCQVFSLGTRLLIVNLPPQLLAGDFSRPDAVSAISIVLVAQQPTYLT
jgi:hypothetical protein